MGIKDRVFYCLARGDTESAVNILIDFLKRTDEKLYVDIILLSGQFQTWKKNNQLGVSENVTEKNKINLSILSLVGELVDAENIQLNELEEDQRRLRKLLSMLPIMVVEINPQGIITYAKGMALAFFGFEDNQLVGRSIHEIPLTKLIDDSFKKCLEEQRIVRSFNNGFYAIYSPIVDANIRTSHISSVALCISSVKEIIEQAEKGEIMEQIFEVLRKSDMPAFVMSNIQEKLRKF